MNATELMSYLTRKQVKSTFEAARRLPGDKLSWKPTPSSRSALDQLQELATAISYFWSLYSTGKMEWDEENYKKWYAERSQIVDLEELERMALADADRLAQHFGTMTAADLDKEVSMPFPGEYKMADIMAYHYWNASYHEGQINYIGTLLEQE